MGVYIKGMEMPTSCPCELVGVGYDLYCSFAHGVPTRVREYDECCEKETRPDWCPLIELPPHGRLVDADEMFVEFVIEGQRSKRYKIGEKWELNGEEIRGVIFRLPTIIEAEEE